MQSETLLRNPETAEATVWGATKDCEMSVEPGSDTTAVTEADGGGLGQGDVAAGMGLESARHSLSPGQSEGHPFHGHHPSCCAFLFILSHNGGISASSPFPSVPEKTHAGSCPCLECPGCCHAEQTCVVELSGIEACPGLAQLLVGFRVPRNGEELAL